MKKNKRISVQEAAAEIKNGDTIIIAGFTVWRKPMSIIYELVRQQRKDLHLIMANPSIGVDILVGAGCLKIWESNYCAMEIFGKIANNFARAVAGRQADLRGLWPLPHDSAFAGRGHGSSFPPILVLSGNGPC